MALACQWPRQSNAPVRVGSWVAPRGRVVRLQIHGGGEVAVGHRGTPQAQQLLAVGHQRRHVARVEHERLAVHHQRGLRLGRRGQVQPLAVLRAPGRGRNGGDGRPRQCHGVTQVVTSVSINQRTYRAKDVGAGGMRCRGGLDAIQRVVPLVQAHVGPRRGQPQLRQGGAHRRRARRGRRARAHVRLHGRVRQRARVRRRGRAVDGLADDGRRARAQRKAQFRGRQVHRSQRRRGHRHRRPAITTAPEQSTRKSAESST